MVCVLLLLFGFIVGDLIYLFVLVWDFGLGILCLLIANLGLCCFRLYVWFICLLCLCLLACCLFDLLSRPVCFVGGCVLLDYFGMFCNVYCFVVCFWVA